MSHVPSEEVKLETVDLNTWMEMVSNANPIFGKLRASWQLRQKVKLMDYISFTVS